MSFAGDWLDLRAPADAEARDPALLAAARSYLLSTPQPIAVDLGAGNGATARAFTAADVTWRLVDHDAGLLAAAVDRVPGAEAVLTDLAHLDSLNLDGVRLVTASALLDLAGETWLDALADRLARRETAIYAALSYDGVLAWQPPHPGDPAVGAAFNLHQRSDKGLGGPAAGPRAAPYLAAALARRGFRVRLAASPWRLGPGPLLDAFIEGVATAASEAGAATASWRQARAGTAAATVGHLDLFAVPAGASAQSNTTSVSSP